MAEIEQSRPGTRSAYAAVLASRMRAQASYRTSFAVDLASSLLVGVIEFAELWLIFHTAKVLGGLDLPAIMLVFALAEIGFSLADMVVGHCDRLPRYMREGKLDVFYLRPQPILMQLITSDLSLRRLARTATGVIVLVVALVLNPIQWSPMVVAMLVLAILCSTAIYGALFVAAAGCQFFLVNGAEFTNAFTYGGRYAGSQPASVWPRTMRLAFGFLIPVAFTGFLPALQLLGLSGSGVLQPGLAWAGPLAAVWAWAVALLLWRLGIRHYSSAGG